MSKSSHESKYEEFVKNVVARTFNQKIDKVVLRSAAVKLEKAVKIEQPKRSAFTKVRTREA